MFTGEYRHAVDDKGRIAVPARFRAQLEERRGGLALDRRLPRDPPEEWLGRARRQGRRLPITDPTPGCSASVFAGALETEMDRQGRVIVPVYLRDWRASTPRRS